LADRLIVDSGVEDDSDILIPTSWHADEPIQDAAFFFAACSEPADVFSPTFVERLAIVVGNDEWIAPINEIVNSWSDTRPVGPVHTSEGLLRSWERTVAEVEAEYRCGIDDWGNDLAAREILDSFKLNPEEAERVRALDRKFKANTTEIQNPVHEDERQWWWFRLPSRYGEEMDEDLSDYWADLLENGPSHICAWTVTYGRSSWAKVRIGWPLGRIELLPTSLRLTARGPLRWFTRGYELDFEQIESIACRTQWRFWRNFKIVSDSSPHVVLLVLRSGDGANLSSALKRHGFTLDWM
jgi:hypothetical protein